MKNSGDGGGICFGGGMSHPQLVGVQRIVRVEGGERVWMEDHVAVEEPLEIWVAGRSVAVVMRTPGHDRELVAGFLIGEGMVRSRDDIVDMVRCRGEEGAVGGGRGERDDRMVGLPVRRPNEPASGAEDGVRPLGAGAGGEGGESGVENRLEVILAPSVAVDWGRVTRNVLTSSSCGICSKASIESLRVQAGPLVGGMVVRRRVVVALPERLRAAQAGYAASGGLHASALFDGDGQLEVVREDVGRHNALDKVIGAAFFAERLPLSGRILLVSGRVSFELMQKAWVAGIPAVVALSAPTTAAVALAEVSGQVLVGFLRGERMNVYAGTLAE